MPKKDIEPGLPSAAIPRHRVAEHHWAFSEEEVLAELELEAEDSPQELVLGDDRWVLRGDEDSW